MARKAKYPFAYFEHGRVDREADLKSAETYVFFTRAPTLEERARIATSCPAPLAGELVWHDRLVYLMSGDTFEMAVLRAYGEPASLAPSTRQLAATMKAFIAAFDAWLDHVNSIVPIAFTEAPVATARDAWGTWSLAFVDQALALLAEHAAEAKCFAWVAERLAALSLAVPVTVDNARTRIGAALAAYGALDFPLPLYSLAGAQRPSDVLGSALATMSAEDRTTTLDALPPLTALTYLATLAAYSRGHVFERSPAQLCALADGVGSHDVWRAASLLVIIAGRIALIDSDEVARDPKHVEMAWSLTQAAIARGASHDRYLRAAQKIAKLQPDPAATEMIDAQVRSLAATVIPDDFEHMRDLLLREMSFGLAEGAVLGFITLGETSGRVDAVADAVKQLLARGLSPLTAELRSALARLHIG